MARSQGLRPVKAPGARFTQAWFVAIASLAVLSAVAIAELGMGREPTCTCGTITLWHGVVNSSENSQQLSDWYSFSHILHGILFYGALALVAPRIPRPLRFLLAVFIEGAWEVVENSPVIIDRYRANTISLDYYGDSIVNSLSDVVAMMAGFEIARRVPVWLSAVVVVTVEIVLAGAIRDNLTLNIVMLLHPFDAIRHWQLGL